MLFTASIVNRSDALVWASVVVGAYRTVEIVFAQAYYLLQTTRTTLTSFTRTMLFHVLFVVEITLHSSVVARRDGDVTLVESLGRGFQAVTLQFDFLSPRVGLQQAVYFGCNLVGIVILLGSLPLVVGVVSKTWDQAIGS